MDAMSSTTSDLTVPISVGNTSSDERLGSFADFFHKFAPAQLRVLHCLSMRSVSSREYLDVIFLNAGGDLEMMPCASICRVLKPTSWLLAFSFDLT